MHFQRRRDREAWRSPSLQAITPVSAHAPLTAHSLLPSASASGPLFAVTIDSGVSPKSAGHVCVVTVLPKDRHETTCLVLVCVPLRGLGARERGPDLSGRRPGSGARSAGRGS